MPQNKFRERKVGEIMANDFRTVAIFKIAGIDFYSGGNETLEKMCTDKNIDITAIETELDKLEPIEIKTSPNFNEWDADDLCVYITNTLNKTLVKRLIKLSFYTDTIADVQGARHPVLLKIAKQFTKINIELMHHLAREEKILFPAIKNVLRTNSSASKSIIVSGINEMLTGHAYLGNGLDNIRELSNNYTVPPDTSLKYLLTYKLLGLFEDDLIMHIHLENNILFPKALELAK